MSNLVFPSLPGLTYPVYRIPTWNTLVKKTASGREFRSRLQLYPTVQYRLKYSFLRDTAAEQHLQQLEAFFNKVGGDFDSFLYEDPDDKSVAGESFGIGDGVTTAWQLTRSRGGFVQPVYDVNGAPAIYVNGIRQYGAARTQYLRSTDDMRNTAERGSSSLWTQTADAEVGVTRPSVTDWDGNTVTVNKLQASTTTNGTNRGASQSLTGFPASQPVTLSIYAKAAEVSCLAILLTMKTGLLASVFFDLVAGTWAAENTSGGVGTGKIEVLANGWSRLSATWADIGGGATTPTAQFYMRRAIGLNLIPAIGDGIYLANPQAEASNEVTAHIVNTNTSSALTDAADYSVSASGLVTFAAPPAAAAALTWSGSYFWRCRFTMPQLELQKFLSTFWEAGKVEFKVVPP